MAYYNLLGMSNFQGTGGFNIRGRELIERVYPSTDYAAWLAAFQNYTRIVSRQYGIIVSGGTSRNHTRP